MSRLVADRPAPDWGERFLCVTVILCKLLYLWTHWNQVSGYDHGDYLPRVEGADWWAPLPPFRTVYFGYHPPLGFFLAHALENGGLTAVHAVQVIATASSIAALLFLRQTLSTLGFIARPTAIFLLYFTAGIPLVVHSGASINQDIVILADSSLVLWLSAALLGREGESSRPARIGQAAILIFVLAGGMLIKFSGILVCSIPVLVAITSSRNLIGLWWRKVAGACLISAAAVCLVFPFYWKRYYQQEGTFFPLNDSYFYRVQLIAARAARDADPVGFFVNYLTPTLFQPDRANPAMRDLTRVRLSQTWRDLWVKDTQLLASNRPPEVEAVSLSQRFGVAYWRMSGIAFVAALAIWAWQLWKKRTLESWDRFGLVLAGYAVVLVAGLTRLYYIDPLPENAIAKGIYIMPIVWFAAYVLSSLFPARRGCVPFVFCWVVINHLLPVY